uniref:Uncharacterized protein n=1 Tax=Oryza barthii TaxID=65489 RepID=A0A0D3G3N4_9ORYZ
MASSDGSGGRAGEEVVGVVERTWDAADDTEQDGVLLVTIFLVVIAVGGCRAEQFGREGEAAPIGVVISVPRRDQQG